MALTRREMLVLYSTLAGTGLGASTGLSGCTSSSANPDAAGSGGTNGSGGSGSGGSGSGGSGSGGSGSGGAGSGGAVGTGGMDAGQAADVQDAPMAGDGPAGGACATTTSTIETNHGHVLMVPGADVAAGATKTYSIKGTATHNHMVTITAAMFQVLKSPMMIMMTSTTTNGHNHVVLVMCA